MEEFNQVNYRYKLSLEITNLVQFKNVIIFGKSLDKICGISANEFVKYKIYFLQLENLRVDAL